MPLEETLPWEGGGNAALLGGFPVWWLLQKINLLPVFYLYTRVLHTRSYMCVCLRESEKRQCLIKFNQSLPQYVEFYGARYWEGISIRDERRIPPLFLNNQCSLTWYLWNWQIRKNIGRRNCFHSSEFVLNIWFFTMMSATWKLSNALAGMLSSNSCMMSHMDNYSEDVNNYLIRSLSRC